MNRYPVRKYTSKDLKNFFKLDGLETEKLKRKSSLNVLLDLVGIEKSKAGDLGLRVDEIYND